MVPAVNFDLSPEQELLRRTVREFAEREIAPRAPELDRNEEFSCELTRAMGELGIEVICADTPQAKGRVERSFDTHQDRLVKELRLAGISTKEAGNRFLGPAHSREELREPKLRRGNCGSSSSARWKNPIATSGRSLFFDSALAMSR